MNIPTDNGGLFDTSNNSFIHSAPTSPRPNSNPATTNSANSPFDSYKINGAFLQQYANDILYNGSANDNGDTGGPFDINSSDFPSLGVGSNSSGAAGSAGTQGSNGQQGGGSASNVSRQQQLQHSVQQQQFQLQQNKSNLYRLAMSGNSTNFNMTTEDFPALPGAPPPSLNVNVNPTSVDNNAVTSRDSTGLYRDLQESISNPVTATSQSNSISSSTGGQPGVASLSGLGGIGGPSAISRLNASSASQSSASVGATSGNNPGSAAGGSSSSAALSGDYGLLGLLAVIRMSDADRNALALGNDLTALGLNLNSSGNLYSTFASPWSDTATSREPHYQLPMCYYMQPPALKTGHLSKFQLETLFYIFYALPKDVLQAYAAQELYSRAWRYHVDLKLWFKRAEPSDGMPQNNNGSPQYIYFDINSWERRPLNGVNQNITSGLLSEEEVRVKFSSS
eukprot:CAMPEP_0196818792 /NCGR_PEP_ID=MMETSP1362-20130617/67556_1 /TAXON_ID=163516 /ORGANISM="Leptocylindrus danicus, Strain CCMP1856" /LENGTH=451 /DNA_ID=CAMNT_0042197045 /DNA_START=167 /DNA_END=1522 /DNA_ORIENTATION=+